MDSIVDLSQTAKGNNSTQIGVQNNYTGLSVADATNMAFAMFREYYPQLRAEALADVEAMVEQRLSSIPVEHITKPYPRTTVPALQNASITEEVEIRELYANLVAQSMDSTKRNTIHPGFVEVIKQLCPDEAKIIRYLSSNSMIPTITLRLENADHSGYNIYENFSDVGELSVCDNPYYIGKYIDNLSRLGLISIHAGARISIAEMYEPLKTHMFITKLEETSRKMDKYKDYPITKCAESFISTTEFGKAFCIACL